MRDEPFETTADGAIVTKIDHEKYGVEQLL